MNDDRPIRHPDIEIKRQIKTGYYRVYGHLYWRPFIVVVLGHVIIGRRRLRREWEQGPEHLSVREQD